MATFRTRWLLSILLVNLPNYCAAAGPPAPPSNLECYIPCDESNCRVDIHCLWDPGPDPQIPANYSLHWEPARSEDDHVTNGNSLSGFIYREQYSSHSDLRVWVQAKNQHGSAKSEEFVFNTANINKPSPPIIISTYQEPFEISWTFPCDQQQLSVKHCDVRHRTEEDQVWNEDEGGVNLSYTFDSPQPGIVYEFQVRCGCDTGLMSDWSAIHRVSSEMDRVGKLDLWKDCGMFHTSVDCVLIWKKLPLCQACGHILVYEVKLSDGMSVNVSTAEPRGQLLCDEMQCLFNSSLKDVFSASVSAYSTHGATGPSHLTIPIQGKEKNEQAIQLEMNEENLTVSWDLPSQFSDNLTYKEYVVQYKQAGSPLGHGFDWVRVKKGHTTEIFKGHFKKYTPYLVSLFTVSHSRECHHHSSVIGYSLQGIPSQVPLFKVDSISATRVTLFWEPVPLSKQNGVILYYQIGVDRQNEVYNVSVSPQHENPTFELQRLSPDQNYEVWLRAVTQAGPGANVTTKFTTKTQENFGYFLPILLVTCILVITCCAVVLLSACRGESKACPLVPSCLYEKVPDPHNSRIFRQMKHQINDPLAWICVPVNEPHPKISLLEVVEIQPMAFEFSLETTSRPDGLTRPAVGDGSSQIDCQDDQSKDAVKEECDKTEHRYGRQEYSKMVDSDEERDREEDRDDSWSSSEEEQFTSGYEKHFMPTVLEVLEV